MSVLISIVFILGILHQKSFGSLAISSLKILLISPFILSLLKKKSLIAKYYSTKVISPKTVTKSTKTVTLTTQQTSTHCWLDKHKREKWTSIKHPICNPAKTIDEVLQIKHLIASFFYLNEKPFRTGSSFLFSSYHHPVRSACIS